MSNPIVPTVVSEINKEKITDSIAAGRLIPEELLDLAKIVGDGKKNPANETLPTLQMVQTAIQEAISIYFATLPYLTGTTVGSMKKILEDLLGRKNKKSTKQALELFTNKNSLVDYRCFVTLHHLALAAQQNDGNAWGEFRKVVRSELQHFKRCERKEARTSALQLLCCYLNAIYDGYWVDRISTAELHGKSHLSKKRRFALAVLQRAGIDSTQFEKNPSRLDDYLNTECP